VGAALVAALNAFYALKALKALKAPIAWGRPLWPPSTPSMRLPNVRK